MTPPTAANQNHLAGEASLYLRQHANNPVHWYPWGDDAFRRAKREEKPIFLSVGYSSCHWCHVMEERVFEHAECADVLNEHYISIKVDREERPDVDRIYMEAVQALTRSGGWPMSVWLTPDLVPFFGGTYFPPETFLDICRKLAAAWEQNRDQIDSTASQLEAYIRRNPLGARPESIDIENVKEAGRDAIARLDSMYGGFEGPMKFPVPPRWNFLLHLYRRTGDLDLAKGVRDTLIAMASGGLQDHIGGGFHRYTVDASWTVPHFEKMLYDNAQLASLYLEAASVFDNKAVFGHVARRTLDFMLRDMHDGEQGGFYGSWDADSDGKEGTFYVWTLDEVKAVVPAPDLEPLCLLLGITPEGNFENRANVLTRRFPPEEVAARTNRPVEEMKTLVETYREALYQAREQRTKPGLDRKIVTSWNALAISAMARGFATLGDVKYLNAARKTAAFLREQHRRADGTLARASTDGTVVGDGILDDYAFLANALLDLFNASGDMAVLEWAIDLVGKLDALFRNDDGGYYHTPLTTDAPLGRQVEILDSVEPSGNAVALRARMRLATLTADEDALRTIRTDIEAYAEIIKKARLEMAAWLDLVLALSSPRFEVCLVGLREGEDGAPFDTSPLLDLLSVPLAPYVEVIPIVGAEAPLDMIRLLPVTDRRGPLDGEPTAYVCQMGSCNMPTRDREELKRQIMDTWMA